MSNSGNSRRQFLQLGAMAASALTASAALPAESNAESVIGMPFTATNPRLGLIGTGGRGTSHIENLLAADVRINALCDIVPEKAKAAQTMVEKAGQKAPELYTDGDHAFEKLTARDDLDLVLVATPWNWHVPMALLAMKNGKHVAVEVPGATTIENAGRSWIHRRRRAATADAGELLLWRKRDTHSRNDSRRAIWRSALRRSSVFA